MLEDTAPRGDCGCDVTGSDAASLLDDIRRHARETHGIVFASEDARLVVLRSQLGPSRAPLPEGARKVRASRGGS